MSWEGLHERSPYRSRLVGERAPSVQQRLADEEKGQQSQQYGHTGNCHRANDCHQQLVTVPIRPPSHTLGGRGQALEAFLGREEEMERGDREMERKAKYGDEGDFQILYISMLSLSYYPEWIPASVWVVWVLPHLGKVLAKSKEMKKLSTGSDF